MANPRTMHDLRGLTLDALEAIFRAAPIGPRPVGCLRGEVLAPVASRLAESVRGRLLLVPFARLPFGLDFAENTWFFGRPSWRLGRFHAERGPSRWRAGAEVLRLTYDRSRLPPALRARLYDEVKPLADGLCLGLGGVNAERGDGELFFFGLAAKT